MTFTRLMINLALVGLAASYLTLGAANPNSARALWWAYALASGGLAVINLILSRGHS